MPVVRSYSSLRLIVALFITLAGGFPWDNIPKDKSLLCLQFSDYICRNVKAIAEIFKNLSQKVRYPRAEMRRWGNKEEESIL